MITREIQRKPLMQKPRTYHKSREGMPTSRCHFRKIDRDSPACPRGKRRDAVARSPAFIRLCIHWFLFSVMQSCFIYAIIYNILGSVFTYTLASRRNPLSRTPIFIYIYVCICKCQIECQMGLGRF